MSPIEIAQAVVICITVAIAFSKHLALSNARSAFNIAVERNIEWRAKANAVLDAQAQRKRVTTPNDMKKANLALDAAIQELI